MKIVISLKPLRSESKTRGIGVYTKELISHLKKIYPEHEIVLSSRDYYHNDADIVHFPFFDPFFLTLPRKKSIPTIITIHDLIPLIFPKHFRRGLRGTIKWFIQKSLVKQVDHIITDSQSSKKDIIRILNYPEKNISVIPLAPSVEFKQIPAKLKKLVKKEYKLPEKYLMYVGDINWNKNILGLIKEFEKIQDDDLHLLLIGKAFKTTPASQELKEITEAIKKSPAKSRIKRLGFIPSHHLPALYALTLFYIQPSWYEGFGLPVLEAMQHGAPVISSDKSSLKEVAGNAAMLFNPEKTGDLSAAIKKLLKNHSKRKDLIAKGKEHVKKFSWTKTAKLTMNVYEKLAQKK